MLLLTKGLAMVIFATPDFGVTGFIMLFWIIIGCIVLLLSVVGIIFGVRLLGSRSSTHKLLGCILFVVSGLLPVASYLTPSLIFHQSYGNDPIGHYPSGKIQNGMSFDQVVSILGTPHQRTKNTHGEMWLYWIDSFEVQWVGLDFGPDGHVINMYGN
jgi:hypothetical protein